MRTRAYVLVGGVYDNPVIAKRIMDDFVPSEQIRAVVVLRNGCLSREQKDTYG